MTTADAELLVVVVDELPEGMAQPEVGKSLTATRRPAILPIIRTRRKTSAWSCGAPSVARSSCAVLRVRTRVDATSSPSSRRPQPVAEMQGCQAALALRGGAPIAGR